MIPSRYNSADITLRSSADFLAELNDEDIDVENSEEYDIFLLIEPKESRPEDLHIENMVLEDDIDQSLVQHKLSYKCIIMKQKRGLCLIT